LTPQGCAGRCPWRSGSSVSETGIVFQLAYPQAEIRFADLKKLSQKFGTDKINITTDFAYSDARGKYGMLIFIDFSMINFIKP
jgi:hypothetical protein